MSVNSSIVHEYHHLLTAQHRIFSYILEGMIDKVLKEC